MTGYRILSFVAIALLGGASVSAEPALQSAPPQGAERVPNLDRWQEWPKWKRFDHPHRVYPDIANASQISSTIIQAAVSDDGVAHAVWRKAASSGSNRYTAVVYASNGPLGRQKDGFGQDVLLKEVNIPNTQTAGEFYVHAWDIVASPDGKLTAAYQVDIRHPNGNYTSFRARQFTPGVGWGAEVPIAEGSSAPGDITHFRSLSLSYDFQGHLHALVFQTRFIQNAGTTHSIMYSKDLASIQVIPGSSIAETFNTPYPVVPANSYTGSPGNPIVRTGPNQDKTAVVVQALWLQWNLPSVGQTLKRAENVGGSWTTSNLYANSVSVHCYDAAVGEDGSVYFTYTDPGNPPATPQGTIIYRKKPIGGSVGSEEAVLSFNPGTAGLARIAVDGRKNPVIVFIEPSNGGFSFATKIGDPATVGTWKYQRTIVADYTTFAVPVMIPARVQVTPGNEFVHVVGDAGVYTRICEMNLGSQDAFAQVGFGPNSSANVVTGNLHFELPLFTAKSGAGFSTSFSLNYNSKDGVPGTMAGGWSTNYDMYLIDHNEPGPGNPWPITVRFSDGRLVTYVYDSTLQYSVALSNYGEFSALRRDTPSPGKYELRTKSMVKYIFDSNGRLEKIQDPNQNTLDLVYGTAPSPALLTEIRDSMYPVRGATVLEYDTKNRLKKVTDPNQKTYTLTYDDSAGSGGNPKAPQLSTVQFDGAVSPQVVKWKFEYYGETSYNPNANPPTADHKNLLSKLYTPRGQVSTYFYQFGYQPDGRVVSVKEPAAASVTDETTLGAGPSSGVQAVRTITYVEPTGTTFDPPNLGGLSQPQRNVPKAVVTDGRGFTTTIEYQYKRCLVDRIVDAQSGIPGSPGVTQRYFDGYDFSSPSSSIPVYRNLIRTVDARQAVTKYTYYDLNQHPSHVKDNLYQIFRPKGLPPTDPDNAASFLQPITYTYTVDDFNRVASTQDARGNTTSYLYDGFGNLTEANYPIGFDRYQNYTRGRPGTHVTPSGSTTFGYSDTATGLVTSIQRPGALGSEGFSYNVMGNTTTHTVAGSGTTTYGYDNLYRLTSQLDPTTAAGTPWSTMGYDADSNLTSVIKPLLNSTTNGYDPLGRLTSVVDSRNGTTNYDYDREGNLRRVKDANTPITTYSSASVYDSVGRVIQSKTITTNPLAGGTVTSTITTTGYDLAGNTTSKAVLGTPDLIMTFSFDARGNVLVVTHPIATITDTYAYDANDNLLSSFRSDTSRPTSFQYGTGYTIDAKNRVTDVTKLTAAPSGTTFTGLTTHYTLNDVGNRLQVKDPTNRTFNSEYDGQNRLFKVKDHFGVVLEQYEYNDAGQRTKMKILSPVTGLLTDFKIYHYNNAEQLDYEVDALGFTTTYAYDLNGNQVLRTDAKGVQTKFLYDELDRLTDETVDYGTGRLNLTTHYGYDSNGNRTSVLDPRGKTYLYDYDSANRLVRVTYPGGSFESWTYDGYGRKTTHTNRGGTATTFGYDNEGRLTSEAHGAPYNVTVQRTQYDGFGNPHQIDDGQVRIANDFDQLGRQLSSSWSIKNAQGAYVTFKSVSYSYDTSSNRQFLFGPETPMTEYGYDDNNRLQTIKWNGLFYVTFGYDAAGRLTDTFYNQAGSANVHRTFNNRLDLLNVKTTTLNNGTLSSCTYAYDEVGNRTSEARDDLGFVKTYSYDRAYRLTSESWSGNDSAGAGFTNAFTDLTGANESGPSNQATAKPLSALSVTPYLALYQYDEAGNRTRKQTSDGTTVYHYDDLNRLNTEDTASATPLSGLSASAPDTQSGFAVSKVIDGDVSDTQVAAQSVWRSQDSMAAHEVTVTLSASTPLTRVTISFPSGMGDLQQFKVQVLSGATYADIGGIVALGAQPLTNPTGYWRSNSRRVTFTFPEVVTTAVKFVQAPGGGPLAMPTVAWLNEIQLYGGTPVQTISYGYDANGNQSSRTLGSTVETFTYDYQFRLSSYTKVTGAATTTYVTYAYTPSNERYQKHVLRQNGTVTDQLQSFMYDGADVVSDYLQVNGATTPSLLVSYVQGLSVDSKIARIAAGVTHYYAADALGSAIQLIDSAQTIVNQNLTTAWGEVRAGSTSSVNDRYGFTQRENDLESGTMHFRARSYDSRTSTFLQKDPVRSGSRYAYANGCPVGMVDPSGCIEVPTVEQVEQAAGKAYLLLADEAPNLNSGEVGVRHALKTSEFLGGPSKGVYGSVIIDKASNKIVRFNEKPPTILEREFDIILSESQLGKGSVINPTVVQEHFELGTLEKERIPKMQAITGRVPIRVTAMWNKRGMGWKLARYLAPKLKLLGKLPQVGLALATIAGAAEASESFNEFIGDSINGNGSDAKTVKAAVELSQHFAHPSVAYVQLIPILEKLGTELGKSKTTFVPLLKEQYRKLQAIDPASPELSDLKTSLEFFGESPD